jgi:hypothetical protein
MPEDDRSCSTFAGIREEVVKVSMIDLLMVKVTHCGLNVSWWGEIRP